MGRTRFETRDADWLSVSEARERILRHAGPLPVVEVALERAPGHALARSLRASATLPPWDNSAMDGYAVRRADVEGASAESPRSLRVVGAIPAGSLPERPVGAGEAARIMTGAPVPPGADSVVRVEDTDAEATPGTVKVLDDRDAGRNVRPAGEDMREGDVILTGGTTVGPGHVAVLAALGLGTVPVHRPARVAVLPNGDELAPLEAFDRVRAGEAIPETNGLALSAAVREIGAEALHLGIAGDSEASIEAHVRQALATDADVLVTVAGASMGESDLFKRVLDRFGFRLDFWRVKMRPGSPISFGLLDRPGDPALPVFGLPGNPASAFVTFHVLVRPYLLALAGHRRIDPPMLTARAATPLRAARGLAHFHRVCLRGTGGNLAAELTGPQGSGLVRSLGEADGLAVVPENVDAIGAGDAVTVMLLRPGVGWNPRAGPTAPS